MGVLDIRRSSVSLQNIAAPRMASVNTGAVEAIGAKMRASQTIAQAIGRFGDDVGEFVDILKRMDDKEEQKQIDKAVMQYQQGMNAYNSGSTGPSGSDTFDKMTGAGTREVQGAMTETVDNPGDWLRNNVDFRDRFSTRLKEDLNLTDHQYQEAKKRLAGFDITMQNNWNQRARQVSSAQEYGAASENWKNATEVVCDRNCAPEAWTEWMDSANRMRSATDTKRGYAMTDEEFSGMMRKRASAVLMSGASQFIGDAVGEAGGKEDPFEAEAVFKDRIAALENMNRDSFLPPSSNLRDPKTGKTFNPFRDALGDTDIDAFKAAVIKGVKDARDEWDKGMRTKVKEGFDAGQEVIAAIPVPDEGDYEAQKEYHREIKAQYERLIAKDPNVTSGRGTEWIRPDLLKWGGRKVAVALQAIKGEDYKADRARQRNNGRLFERAIAFGVPDESSPGGSRQLSANEKIALSEFMYSNDEIDYPAYAKGVRAAKEQTDPLAADFLALVSQGMSDKFPHVCQWQKEMMAFDFRDTKEAQKLAAKGTGVRTKVARDDTVQGKVVTKYDKTEEWLYKQAADAATLVVNSIIMEGQRKGESKAELLNRAKAEYDKLTQGVNDGIYRLSIDRRRDAYRANLDSLKNARLGRPTRWLPQGIELGRGKKVEGTKNKDKEDR